MEEALVKKNPILDIIIIRYARSFGNTTTLNVIVEEALKKSNLGYLSMKEGSLFVLFCTCELQRELGCFKLRS
jgi:hypothetical protein